MPRKTLTSTPAKRDTGWKRDGREKGVYWRTFASGKGWGYYAAGKIQAAQSRDAAIEGRDDGKRRKRQGLPEPDGRVTIAVLAEDVRASKRRKLAGSSFDAFEYALDKVILPELGELRVVSVGPDRLARLVRDLETHGVRALDEPKPLKRSSVRRYVSPLGPIFKLALRRGIIATDPWAILSDDERPSGGGVSAHYEWSAETISKVMTAAEERGALKTANYDYAPLLRVLVVTGLRVSEALALRWQDVDLLNGLINVRHSWSRRGALTKPKTAAGLREVPIAPGLVDLLVTMKPEQASETDHIFSTTGARPVSYHNFWARGFTPALERAGLDGKGITIHDLRSAAISLYAARGLSMLETSIVMGQADPGVTWKHYARLFDRSDVHARIRAAQASLDE
jgi:integrase